MTTSTQMMEQNETKNSRYTASGTKRKTRRQGHQGGVATSDKTKWGPAKEIGSTTEYEEEIEATGNNLF